MKTILVDKPNFNQRLNEGGMLMRYVCRICGYVYDEATENVSFDSLPDTWKCPWCGADKSDFEAEGSEKPAELPPAPLPVDNDMQDFSAGRLSVLCSNLARGCEKQYKPEEAAMFSELADYFRTVTPPVKDAAVEMIAELLKNDIENYPALRAAADIDHDRGAARVCVWGEKVTRMLSSLVSRYLKEGEAMLADTDIWVCTVCGFVYVGDKAPELCPVCKVPAWKFEKIKGGNR